MENIDDFIRNLYLNDDYIIKNPSLHEISSPWKVIKIIPFVDRFFDYTKKDEINLLRAQSSRHY